MAIYTVPGNLLSTYDAGFFGGNAAASAIVHHEDLTDVAVILDSTQSPFFSGAPKIRARDVVHSWPIDSLANPSSAGSPDGVDASSGDAQTPPRRLFNMTQIFRRDVIVSDRERESNSAGVRDMYQYQITKKFKEIARDFEFTVFRNDSASTATATGGETDDPTGAPRMTPFLGQFGAGGRILTAASAGAGTFVSADLNNLCSALYVRGGEPDSIWFSPDWKLKYIQGVYGTGSFGGAVRNIAADDKRIVTNVEVYESPMGQLLAVIVDRFIPMGSASASGFAYYIGDRSMAKVAFFRPPQHKPLGKTGDNTKGIVMMEATLHLDHPSSWAALTQITGNSGIV